MKESAPNHYERAFEIWLLDHRVKYVPIDDRKRCALGGSHLKNFDFLVYPANGDIIIAEVKGRRFHGNSFTKLSGLECWVTTEDVDGLAAWQKALGTGYKGVFIFAHRSDKVDVDFDGRDVFDFDNCRYLFFAVGIDDYIRYMKQRSPKWRTVTLPAAEFRRCAAPIAELLL